LVAPLGLDSADPPHSRASQRELGRNAQRPFAIATIQGWAGTRLEAALAAPNILLQNTSGQVSIWEMQGNTIVGAQLQCLPQASFPHHFLEPRVALPPRPFAGKGNLISHKTLDRDDGSPWGAKYRIEGAGAFHVAV
jgi:hypothetical protein